MLAAIGDSLDEERAAHALDVTKALLELHVRAIDAAKRAVSGQIQSQRTDPKITARDFPKRTARHRQES